MIAGIGPALVDHIYRIENYPPPGGHAVVKSSTVMPGGAAGNVIFGLSRFGVECRFYTTVGEDDDAKFYISSLEGNGVDVRYSVSHPETGKCHIYVDEKGERTFFVHPNAAGRINLKITDADLRDVDYLYLDPFPTEGSFEFHLDIARRGKRLGCKVIINPGFPYISLGFETLSQILDYCDIVFMSKDEIKDFSVRDFQNRVGLLVITLGKDGSMAFTREEKYYAEAFDVEVVDTTGAGDAFAAGFIYAYLNGFDIETCLKSGNFVASKNIQHFGARNFPEKEEVDRFLDLI
ncbi:carbohydrate kinase family protein [Archaeoglobales archaeon]|nr:MAG: carbohydrate kinase family protein [Archaeoglobales archaeon]